MSDRDDRLEAAFQSLRDEEARRAPDLSSVLAGADTRRRARRSVRVRRGAAALLAAAALTFAVARTIDRPATGGLAEELLATPGLWRAPTDVLLERRATPLWRNANTRWLRVRHMAREDG